MDESKELWMARPDPTINKHIDSACFASYIIEPATANEPSRPRNCQPPHGGRANLIADDWNFRFKIV
jgi:hypothetical protein